MVVSIVIPILQMTKMRLRAVKKLSLNHRTGKCQAGI